MQDNRISFKSRVRSVLVTGALTYRYYFVDYDYLVCSESFKREKYYIISANKNNYLHLTGVQTALSADAFFDKCFRNTLSEDDFEVDYKKGVKGSIRRKIQVLSNIGGIFQATPLIEEDYQKNHIYCSFAAGIDSCTLGFIQVNDKSYPRTLLKGNLVDRTVAKAPDLVLRRKRKRPKFTERIVGSREILRKHYDDISDLISDHLKRECED